MNEIMWKLSVGKKSLGPHWFHCWLTVSLYIAEGGFNIIKSTLCLLAIKWTDTQIWTHRHSHKCRLTCTHLNARISCRSCKKKSCKSLSRNVLLFNKSMASPVENVSLLPRRGVKCEQAAGPTGGPALTPVVWILCGRVWALPTLQVPVEKPHPCYTVARAHLCAHTAPPFRAWELDVMPRLCPLCAHRKHSAAPGISRADFPISYPCLRCSSNLLVSIFTHQSCSSPSLSQTLPPQCQPFPPGWARLMGRQPLAAISAQSGRNPLPTPLHPSSQPLPDLRLPDTLQHTCFPF